MKYKIYNKVANLRPVGRIRPAEVFFPARDLLLSSGPRLFFFFNDRYAPINRRNDPPLQAKTFFWSSPSIRPKKRLNFWRRPFSFGPLEWWRSAGTLLELDVAHQFKRLLTPDL